MKRLIVVAVLLAVGVGIVLWVRTRSGDEAGPTDLPVVRMERGTARETVPADRVPQPPTTVEGTAPVPTQTEQAPRPPQMSQSPSPRKGSGGSGQMSAPPTRSGEADRAKMREQMMTRMLEQANLTEKEKTAAKKNMEAKDQARQALSDDLTKLRRTANKANPSNTELQNALTAYRAAMAKYRKQVEAADQSLIKQLSLKAQVRCMSLGILDNGLGRMGMAGGGRRSR